MPIPIVCPSCGRSGKLPDNFPGGQVKCPACGVVSNIPAPPAPRPASSRPAEAARKAKPAPASDPLWADDEIQPLPRTPAPRQGQVAAPAGLSPSSLLYAAIGLGGVVVVLLVGLIVLLTSRSGGKDDKRTEPVAQAAPAPPAPQLSLPKPQPAPPATEPAGSSPATPPLTQAAASPPAVAPGIITQTSSAFTSLSADEAIRRVKDATVLIKVKLPQGQGSGTGFVIQTAGDGALIATNRHVVSHHDDDDEPAAPSSGAAPELSVVFRSGERSGVEQVLPASVVAVESEPGPSRDLAILSVRGVRNPPIPIEPATMVAPVEGMPLKIYGFPFGERINVESKGNPVATLSKGMVSALQKDRYGRLSVVQLDGSVQPGNSGGPVVDERGRLVGVTVAKFRAADGMGLAVPAVHLAQLLEGRPGAIAVVAKTVQPGGAELTVVLQMADPLKRVRDVEIRFAPADTDPASLQPDSNGSFALLPNGRRVPLVIKTPLGTATGQLQVPLGGPAGRRIALQVSYRDGRGRLVSAQPVAYEVPSAPGPMAAVGDKGKLVEKIRTTSLGRLGSLIDPDKDCEEERTEKGLVITIPGKLHTLSPQIVDKKKKPLSNAPRALADIDGDFLAHVKVAGDMHPGNEPAAGPGGQKIPLCVQGGGLLLWQDQNNFLRLERSCGAASGDLTLHNRLILEVYQNGHEAGRTYVDIDEGVPLHVMLVRVSGHLRCLFSNDPHSGWKVFHELVIEFPAKVSIGVSAFNISKKPYTAKFEDFVLLMDKDKIESELKPQ